jgi:hypothetical protein
MARQRNWPETFLAKPLIKVLVSVVVLMAFSALTMAGLNTLDVQFVRRTLPNQPTKVPKPRCWKVVNESDENDKPRHDPGRPPRPKRYLLVPEGQGRVMPCDADESPKD